MKILLSYRGIPASPGWETGSCVARAFRNMGHEVSCYGNYYETNRYLEYRPNGLDELWDLFLFLECGDGEPTYNELITVKARKRASWFFDAALYIDKWRSIVSAFNFDVNFIANSRLVNIIPYGVYLPYAADETLHFRPLDWPKKRDFALVGSDRPERRQLIAALQAAGLDAHLITNVFRDEYIDALASTRVVINDIAGGGQGLISMRLQETMAAGSVLFTPEEVGLDFFGQDTKHYIVYKNMMNLLNKIRLYYNPEILTRIANVAQENCLKNHLYINRCEEILKLI